TARRDHARSGAATRSPATRPGRVRSSTPTEESIMRSAYTRLVHGGSGPDPATGAILTPIHQVTTYVQEAVGVHKGFTYTRSGNPTVRALESVLAAAEGTSERAVAFSTGMAATTALFLSELSAGEHVVCGAVGSRGKLGMH